MGPLNCILDDSALVASVKPNAQHSVVPWINQGNINVFVPLYALERLARLSRIQCSVSADASKALRWLDQVTSWTEHKTAGRVKLQGPEDQYLTWDDVEKHLLPETPLTANNGPQRVDRLSKMLDRGTNPDGQAPKPSPTTSPTSTASSLSSSTPAVDETISTLSAHGIASQIRPLLNYTVWCTQQAAGQEKADGKFVLITNDQVIQKQASKFGVRAKLLNQLQTVLGKTGPATNIADVVDPKSSEGCGDPLSPGMENGVEDDGDDEVVFDPSARPKSSRGTDTADNVMDPNHFGRSPKLQPQRGTIHPADRGNGRGTRNGRGKGSNGRGRGANRAASNSASPPTGPSGQQGNGRGRGSDGNGNGKGNGNTSRSGAGMLPRQIDPDSFVRPAHMGRRGRGSVHKLWEPTSSG